MADLNKCDECGHEFTSRSKYDPVAGDVDEQDACDIIDGQYTEWTTVTCPKCGYVQDLGR